MISAKVDAGRKGRQKAFAGSSWKFLIFPALWFLNTGHFQDGGNDINDMAGSISELTLGLYSFWPMGDEWGTDSAFMHPGLMPTEGGVPST